MTFPPREFTDTNERDLGVYGDTPHASSDGGGFVTPGIPGASGLTTRQGQIQDGRPATVTRKLIHWLLPEGPMVEMYVNPKQIVITQEKDIKSTRTKGGFIIQYWGEKLITLGITGTTGSSGIEGINVLNDVYRNEQIAFEPYALYAAQQYRQDMLTGDVFGVQSALSTFKDVGGLFSGDESAATLFEGGQIGSILGLAQESSVQSAKMPPTLASLASTVEMYHSGEVYRGFFTKFAVTESAENIGLFDYDLQFTATQKRGFRTNFFAWHRSAVSGPSTSDPISGAAYSYTSLARGNPGRPL